MDKHQFAKQLLTLVNKFLKTSEKERLKIGKEISVFFKKNYQFSKGGDAGGEDAFTDPAFSEVAFLEEGYEYNKICFPEEDFLRAKRALEKVAGKK